MDNFKKILAGFTSLTVALAVVILSSVLYMSGIIDASEPPDTEVIEGIFLDRNGIEITSYSPEGKNSPATLNFGKSMSHLIGYNSSRMGKSGLRQTLSEHLFEGGKDKTGATVTLTIDAYLQEGLCSLLDGHKGSISIVNAKTGEIIVLLSRSDKNVIFEADRVDEVYKEDGENTLYYSDFYNTVDGIYINTALQAEDSGGSVIKVLTSISLLENGYADLTFYDATGTFLNNKIVNYGNMPYYDCNLPKALLNSVNVYFANAGLVLGNKRLADTFGSFMVGKDVDLDLGKMCSNYANSQLLDDFLLASNAYGQGQTQISSLHLASVFAAIMNNGNMMKPYVIDSISDDGKTVSETVPEVLSEASDKNTCQALRKMLINNARDYGLYDGITDEDVTIIAKTGTAQVHRNEENHIYYGVGVQIGDNAYGICVDFIDEAGMSSILRPTVKEVLSQLIRASRITG